MVEWSWRPSFLAEIGKEAPHTAGRMLFRRCFSFFASLPPDRITSVTTTTAALQPLSLLVVVVVVTRGLRSWTLVRRIGPSNCSSITTSCFNIVKNILKIMCRVISYLGYPK